MTVETASTVGCWHPAAPSTPERLVVAAPHPDDELLGAAGILRWASDRGVALTIVACTDGEGSHPRSLLTDPGELRRRRASEREAALGAFGIAAEVVRLGLPDGSLAAFEGQLAEAMRAWCAPGSVLVVPWRHDGHADHESLARAGLRAAAGTGASVWQVPIWAKVRRGRPLPAPFASLQLSAEARRAKATAVGLHRSQLVALGPRPEDGPVVHPHELALMLDGWEMVLP